MKCWWTMPIPRSIASFGERIATGLPVDADLALVGLVEAVEDVHQRRLAGAVLAEQRVHLAAPEVEVDAVVRDDAPGKRFVIPFSSRRRARLRSCGRQSYGGGRSARPRTYVGSLLPSVAGGSIVPSFRPASALSDGVLDASAAHRRGSPSAACASGSCCDAVELVRAALEVAVLERLDHVEHGRLERLQRARDHAVALSGLVDVDADRDLALLARARRALRGRTCPRPGRRRPSRARSGRARSPCTWPGRRSRVEYAFRSFTLGFVCLHRRPGSRRSSCRPAGSSCRRPSRHGAGLRHQRRDDAGEVARLLGRVDHAERVRQRAGLRLLAAVAAARLP